MAIYSVEPREKAGCRASRLSSGRATFLLTSNRPPPPPHLQAVFLGLWTSYQPISSQSLWSLLVHFENSVVPTLLWPQLLPFQNKQTSLQHSLTPLVATSQEACSLSMLLPSVSALFILSHSVNVTLLSLFKSLTLIFNDQHNNFIIVTGKTLLRVFPTSQARIYQ